MPNFVGFSGEQVTQLRRVHQTAKDCVTAAVNSMASGSGAYMIRYNTYFGSAATAKGGWGNAASSNVNKTISAMFVALNWDHFEVKYSTTPEDPDDNAGMMHLISDSPHGGFEGKNVIEHHADFAASDLCMEIYPNFLAAPFFAMDRQCQVQIYLHELSHHAGGTIDVKLGDGSNAYHMTGVRGANAEAKGHLNAENFGMFLNSFYAGGG